MQLLFYTFREWTGFSFKIMEVAITSFKVQKLMGNKTLEDGAHESALYPSFVNSADEQVNVIHRAIHLF